MLGVDYLTAENGRMSIRQAAIIFFVMTASPGIRIFPQFVAKIVGKAGWLTPIVAIIPMILLILIINSFFKNNKEANLCDIYYKVLGNVTGRIILFLYLLWILMLTALYVRFYAERVLTSMMPHTSITFLIITMVILVFITVRRGVILITRFSEAFFGIFIATLGLIFIMGISRIKLSNYMNVSYQDVWPMIKASYGLFSIWGYWLYVFFFGEKINKNENIKKFGFQALFLIVIMNTLILMVIIGSMGPYLTANITLPFFILTKNISILDVVERVESIALALWVISDFILITILTYVTVSIMKSIFKLSEIKWVTSPLIVFEAIGSLFFFRNIFELETFSRAIVLPGNIVFEFLIPAIVFGIGKIRKVI
jgi:spore germination protein (amino acid permease)